MKKNIVPHNYQIKRNEREKQAGHRSVLLWFTGLSGSGKSTIANMVEYKLHEQGVRTFVLDGDNVRGGLNKDLSFSAEDRTENIRRIGEVANLMLDAGLVVLAAFISPYQKDREKVKLIVQPENYIEVYVDTSLEACEQRDVKGLYAKARRGEIKNMTGISAPYEVPQNPDIVLQTEGQSIEESVNQVLQHIVPILEIKK